MIFISFRLIVCQAVTMRFPYEVPFGDVYEILRFAQDDKMEDRMTGWRHEGLLKDS